MANYFETFFSEKNLPYAMFEIELDDEVHMIDNETVIEMIKTAPAREQAQIKQMIVKIDFVNGDVNDFLRHLAECFVKTQRRAA